jgi:hypothetical protein
METFTGAVECMNVLRLSSESSHALRLMWELSSSYGRMIEQRELLSRLIEHQPKYLQRSNTIKR